ncbi:MULTISPECIES: LemA family protein [Marinobacter]|jgi:LemA protein|uniref:LemA n=1 Tax=Marinobacter psychrophilus TaxID=330734 RepID=A0A0H4I2H5_9GAMM|nr:MULTISPECIES: LemA family protein [Marinobacter]AFP29906.1 Protein LemA [Marinobacter sp. BSs20148]AKO51850.1 LemA [Marinobacter psychrophilus]MBQ0762839.1 LemA family protein [Marinobacter psychrophilus]MBQ0846223.1 LemA family protein [Marinobacter psychrophilus]
MTTTIGLIIIAAIALFLVIIYNRLVALRNQFRNGFAQIDVQLQRRHDLIPNLVESAKAYLSHEKNTLTQVMNARNNAVDAQQEAAKNPDDGKRIQRLGGAENMLTKALANFYAVAENYPDLKANETIQQLMEELSSTENRVSFARQAYNDTVMTYNTYREQFPNNVIAGLFAFQETSQLQLETPEARYVPKVSF